MIKLFRPTLVFPCILFMISLSSGCTANDDGNSEISQVQTLNQENSESENTETEKILEDFAKSNMESNVEPESDIIAEPDIESELDIIVEPDIESELETLTESDEPVAISQLDYDSFQSRMTDKEWDGFSQYFPILKENADFNLASWSYDEELNKDGEIAKDGEDIVFYCYTPGEITNINAYATRYDDDDRIEAMLIQEVSVFDLDGDGVEELILQWTPVGDFLIFHREGEDFYAWEIMYRGFEMLQTNGVFIGSGGAGSNGWYLLRFDNGIWVKEKLAEEDWGEFHVHGEKVDEETFRQQIDNYMTENVTAYVPRKVKSP